MALRRVYEYNNWSYWQKRIRKDYFRACLYALEEWICEGEEMIKIYKREAGFVDMILVADLMAIVKSVKDGCPADCDHSSLDIVLYEMFEKKE